MESTLGVKYDLILALVIRSQIFEYLYLRGNFQQTCFGVPAIGLLKKEKKKKKFFLRKRLTIIEHLEGLGPVDTFSPLQQRQSCCRP